MVPNAPEKEKFRPKRWNMFMDFKSEGSEVETTCQTLIPNLAGDCFGFRPVA
jgi:hypothetical protein